MRAIEEDMMGVAVRRERQAKVGGFFRRRSTEITVGSRTYYDCTVQCWPACMPCEHCDGERSNFVRHDSLRGLTCPHCDSSLDEMLEE